MVVIHDNTTNRTTGKAYKIMSTPSNTLRLLDAGSWKDPKFAGEKIPFLEEILEALPNSRKLVIEIKSDKEIVPWFKTIVEASGKRQQCIIISFDKEALIAAKQAMNDIPAYYLSSGITMENFSSVWSELKNSKIDGLNLSYKSITPELASTCQNNKVPLYAWTVDDIAIARKLIHMGVIGITTNKPLEMREGLKEL
ncbi:MAG: hypothetical protein HC830_07220 [Bacteroidetes bacterium]|nr:hypothetical protein [Bacteroidota bacterium]